MPLHMAFYDSELYFVLLTDSGLGIRLKTRSDANPVLLYLQSLHMKNLYFSQSAFWLYGRKLFASLGECFHVAFLNFYVLEVIFYPGLLSVYFYVFLPIDTVLGLCWLCKVNTQTHRCSFLLQLLPEMVLVLQAGGAKLKKGIKEEMLSTLPPQNFHFN